MRIQRLSQYIIGLIVFGIAVLYFIYPELLMNLGKLAVALAPAVIFFAGGIIIFSRDIKRVKQTQKNQEYSQQTTLTWGQSLKHDLVMFFVPVLILAWPYFSNQLPTGTDVFQAAIAFLAFVYLKYLYWKQLWQK